jgi:hypothetical protein
MKLSHLLGDSTISRFRLSLKLNLKRSLEEVAELIPKDVYLVDWTP